MLLVILILGLAVSGYLVHRHPRRVSPATPTRDLHAVDAWQRGIRLDPRTDYSLTAAAREKLRREEERQRPQEGRN
jgi:hypothetical protein